MNESSRMDAHAKREAQMSMRQLIPVHYAGHALSPPSSRLIRTSPSKRIMHDALPSLPQHTAFH